MCARSITSTMIALELTCSCASFQDLASLSGHSVRLESSGVQFCQLTEATPLQSHPIELLSTPARRHCSQKCTLRSADPVAQIPANSVI